MSQGLQVGRISGAPIYIKPSWFLLSLLLLLVYSQQLSAWPSLSSSQAIGAASLMLLLLGLGVFLHELVHALLGRWQGLTVRSISLNIWGGQTLMTTGSAPTSILVALGGPLTNFLLAALSYLIWQQTASPQTLGFLLGAQLNLAVGIFNLLPASSLDGGLILEALVTQLTGRRSSGLKASTYANYLLLALLVFLVLGQGWYSSPFLLLASAALAYFLFSSASKNSQRLALNRETAHPLSVASLTCPVIQVGPEQTLGEFLTNWDGISLPWIQYQASSYLISPELLKLSQASQLSQPLLSFSLEAAPEPLPLNLGYLDVLDHYQGYLSHRLPQELQQAPAWLVEDRGQVVGAILGQEIAQQLSAR